MKLVAEAYRELLENELQLLIPQGLTPTIYTKTTGMEIEINGYFTYDRKVEKIEADFLRQLHVKLYRSFGTSIR